MTFFTIISSLFIVSVEIPFNLLFNIYLVVYLVYPRQFVSQCEYFLTNIRSKNCHNIELLINIKY